MMDRSIDLSPFCLNQRSKLSTSRCEPIATSATDPGRWRTSLVLPSQVAVASVTFAKFRRGQSRRWINRVLCPQRTKAELSYGGLGTVVELPQGESVDALHLCRGGDFHLDFLHSLVETACDAGSTLPMPESLPGSTPSSLSRSSALVSFGRSIFKISVARQRRERRCQKSNSMGQS